MAFTVEFLSIPDSGKTGIRYVTRALTFAACELGFSEFPEGSKVWKKYYFVHSGSFPMSQAAQVFHKVGEASPEAPKPTPAAAGSEGKSMDQVIEDLKAKKAANAKRRRMAKKNKLAKLQVTFVKSLQNGSRGFFLCTRKGSRQWRLLVPSRLGMPARDLAGPVPSPSCC